MWFRFRPARNPGPSPDRGCACDNDCGSQPLLRRRTSAFSSRGRIFTAARNRRCGTLSTTTIRARPAEPLSRLRHPAARVDRAGNRRSRRLYGIAYDPAAQRTGDCRAGATARDGAHEPATARYGPRVWSKTAAAGAPPAPDYGVTLPAGKTRACAPRCSLAVARRRGFRGRRSRCERRTGAALRAPNRSGQNHTDDTLRNLTFPRSFQLEDGHQMSDLHQ